MQLHSGRVVVSGGRFSRLLRQEGKLQHNGTVPAARQKENLQHGRGKTCSGRRKFMG